MHKSTQITAALLLSASFSLMAAAADADAIFVKVNGVPVSQNLADAFIAEQKAKGMEDTPELRNAVREELIRRALLVQQAKAEGIDKKPEIAMQIEVARQIILGRSYVQQYLQKNPVKDEQLKAEYDKIKAQFDGTEYKARHILVKEESKAKDVIARLKKGAKFKDLAKQSTDPGTKDKGGELEWASSGNYVQPFADALTRLKKGKFTETPVKSQFGYHVILLEDTRPTAIPSFEELKPRLLQQVQAQQITQMADDLRNKAKIE